MRSKLFLACFSMILGLFLNLPVHAYSYTAPKTERLINQERIIRGVIPLKHHAGLCKASKMRLRQTSKTWSHAGFWKNIQYIKNSCDCDQVGENLARDFGSPERMVNGWMASYWHRWNVLETTYNAQCVVTDGYNTVSLFGRTK